ncbi:hypothetical protein NEMIN01_2406, partial [Nematocida minor]|uniref:uncharacterized protein n=1 Tax=Nematocida minor TaxID=1912983 RepID=UPI00221F442C
ENSEIFSREDLQIITAIKENIGEIACEKIIHSCVIRALEYIANNTDLLRETENGSNTLKIKKDLSNFYEDYIANRDLGKLIQQRKDKITEKIKTKTKALGEEETKYYQIKESASREKIEDAICTINSLENDVYRLECDKKKECLQPEYMQSLLNSLLLLSEVSPEQESYLFEKIKEFGKAMSIEIVELSKEHQTAKEKEKEPKKRRLFTMKAIHAKIAKTLLLAAILLTPPLLVNYYCSNGGVMGAADNGNPVNCEESSYYE